MLKAAFSRKIPLISDGFLIIRLRLDIRSLHRKSRWIHSSVHPYFKTRRHNTDWEVSISFHARTPTKHTHHTDYCTAMHRQISLWIARSIVKCGSKVERLKHWNTSRNSEEPRMPIKHITNSDILSMKLREEMTWLLILVN